MDGIQKYAVEKAIFGHSFLLAGQAGTGKTRTLYEIIRSLKKLQNVQVTASTGIAATQFADFQATTIHQFAGLLDGRFTDEELVNRVTRSDEMTTVRQKIERMDTLVIDEISMVSASIFHQLDLVIRTVRNSNLPFGGVQCIVSGDFNQLPPVPNAAYGDKGQYAFETELWEKAIPHVITLTKIHRQRDDDLITAVHEIA